LLEIGWYFQQFNWGSVLDILLVALTFYWILRIIRRTQAEQLLRGAVVLVVIMVLAANVLPFRAFGWLVDNGLPALLVAIPVILQPELRRALERLGRTVGGGTGGYLGAAVHELSTSDIVEEVVAACTRLSERHHGALIVLERSTGLEEVIESGVRLDSQVTMELLLTIFFPNTALHDGAVVVRRGRAVAAACVLPLTDDTFEDRRMGLRHRASLGVTEETDAVAVVVSEETGVISVARNGRITRGLSAQQLLEDLQETFPPSRPPSLSGLFRDVRHRVGDALGDQKQ
jgi:diadenylate cyclase